MPTVRSHVSISLDGFVAGPGQRLDAPLGDGGERLHEWAVRSAAWRRQHGLEGGDVGSDSRVLDDVARGIGAYVMGRNMFGPPTGAEAIQQHLVAGLLEELHLHIVPILLGEGARLLENVGDPKLEPVEVVASRRVTHIRYRVT